MEGKVAPRKSTTVKKSGTKRKPVERNYRSRTNITDLSTIGGRIIAARKQQRMGQDELAALIHVSQRSMQAYEADEVIPYRHLRALSALLDKPEEWILHGDKPKPENQDELELTLQEIKTLLREGVKALKAISHNSSNGSKKPQGKTP